METKGNRPSDEDESRDDRRLVEELESLYREVARSDHPATEPEQGIEDHRQGERGDELHPSGTMTGTGSAAETASRHSERHLPDGEELLERLNRIRRAYEMLLTCWPYASVDSPMADIKRT